MRVFLARLARHILIFFEFPFFFRFRVVFRACVLDVDTFSLPCFAALSCKNQPLSQSSHLKTVWPLVNFHILTGNLISTLQIFACDV